MRTCTTVELAQFIESDVHEFLLARRKYHGGDLRFVPVFELFQSISESSYGSQVTSGFFGKVLSDMRKAGILVAQNGGRFLALSEEAWKVQDNYAKLRQEFDDIADSLIERGIFKDVAAVGEYLKKNNVPFEIDRHRENGIAVEYDVFVENRFLDLAVRWLRTAEKILSSQKAVTDGR